MEAQVEEEVVLLVEVQVEPKSGPQYGPEDHVFGAVHGESNQKVCELGVEQHGVSSYSLWERPWRLSRGWVFGLEQSMDASGFKFLWQFGRDLF